MNRGNVLENFLGPSDYEVIIRPSINTMDINELSPTLTAWLQKECQGMLLDVCLRLLSQHSRPYRGCGYAD